MEVAFTSYCGIAMSINVIMLAFSLSVVEAIFQPISAIFQPIFLIKLLCSCKKDFAYYSKNYASIIGQALFATRPITTSKEWV